MSWWNTSGAYSALWGQVAGRWDAWKGTNSGFDQSINPTTNNDVPMPIPAPASASPFIPNLFQNPFPRLQIGQSNVTQNLLLTVLAVAAVTTVFRAPLITSVPKQSSQPAISVPNLLTSTLAPAVVASPFLPADLAQPRTRAAYRQSQDQQNLLTTPGLTPPFRQSDWPGVAKRAGIQQQGFQQNLLLAPGIAPPFLPTALAQPALKRISSQAQDYQNLLVGTLAQAIAVPFKQSDWQTPASGYQQRTVSEVNLLTNTLAVIAAAAPFTPMDFSMPRISVPVLRIDMPPNLLTGVLGVDVDVGTTEWIVRARRRGRR